MAFRKEYIIGELESGNYDQLFVYDTSEKSQIGFWEGKPNELIASLENFYANCEQGRYKFKIHNSKHIGNSGRSETAKARIIPVHISGNESRGTDSYISSERSDYRDKYEELRLQLLKLELQRDFEAKNDSQAESTNALLMGIFKEITSKKKVVGSAIGEPLKPVESKSDTREIIETLQEWQEVDPDFFESLQKLVKLAKNNPDRYNLAKNMLPDEE